MYSQRIVSNDNDNQLTCGKCAYTWLEQRGLPPENVTCPRCKSNVIRKGLVQFRKTNRDQPTSVIDEINEMLNFAMGDDRHQWQEMNK